MQQYIYITVDLFCEDGFRRSRASSPSTAKLVNKYFKVRRWKWNKLAIEKNILYKKQIADDETFDIVKM
jgi:hypothetical protein